MYCGFGFSGVMPLATPLNGNGCSEQTSLVSTATERNNAQKSWAPRSREPDNAFAASLKSSKSMGSSRSSICPVVSANRSAYRLLTHVSHYIGIISPKRPSHPFGCNLPFSLPNVADLFNSFIEGMIARILWLALI